MSRLTRLILLDDLNHLTHVQGDLGALLLLVVGDGHVLVEQQGVGRGRVPYSKRNTHRSPSMRPSVLRDSQ